MSASSGGEPGRKPLAWVLSLISCAVLLYEILLTRIFSVVLLYHFAYVAISLALLGFSVGALVVHYRPSLHGHERLTRTVVSASSGFAVSVLACTLVLIHFQPSGVSLYDVNLPTLRYLALAYAAATLPFILAGVAVSVLLAAGRSEIGRFYALDLLGAAAGAVAVIPLLGAVGGPGGMLVAAGLAAGSGLLLWHSQSTRLRLLPLSALAAIAAVSLASTAFPVLSVRFTKGELERDVLFEGWNSLSRVTANPFRDAIRVRIDSGAATTILPASRHAMMAGDINSPAMHLRPRGDILVIGSGGGPDIAAAATIGMNRITGVEINPLVVELATGRFREMAGGLYDRENVRIVNAEGRSFLRRSDDVYDVVMLTLVDTWAATAAGAFALSENHLYTVEAFQEYLGRLSPDGVLSVTRWYFPERPHETLRLVAICRSVLEALGVDEPARHVVIVAERGPHRRATLLLKKTAFTAEDRSTLESLLAQHPNWELVYSDRRARDPRFGKLLAGADPEGFYASYEYDVSPPSDDRPFYFYVVRPGELWSSFASDFYALPNVTNIGVFLLVASFVADAAFAALLIAVPLLVTVPGRRTERSGLLPVLTYFACLGAGFMIVELSLMQRFILYLGHPTLALTVVLFVLLCATGVGSLFCGRQSDRNVAVRLPRWIAAAVALGAVYAFSLPVLFDHTFALPEAGRIGVSVLCLAPLGFLLGTCLPSGVRLLGGRSGELLPWVWAINGGFSVLGSAAAMLYAMSLGFRATLLLGLALYALAMLCATRLPAFGAAATAPE